MTDLTVIMSEEPTAKDPQALSLTEFTTFFNEITQQPAWRSKADKESDYYDGNQLDSEILRKQAEIGMPPAIEPLIGPTIDSVLGMEAKTRTDWRVIPDGDKDGDDVAAALNHKLNQAERQSKADRAVSDAYASQVKVGLGWVEVSRDADPFKYPYRCKSIHRNEIWWDFLAKEPDLSDARYLVRRRWTDRSQAALMFPDSADLIKHAGSGWSGIDMGMLSTDGGMSTGLAMAWSQERGWSVEEQEWRDQMNNRICLFEVWYRRWVRVLVLKTPDGRIVELDMNNEMHVQAAAAGMQVYNAVVSRMRVSWWMGPHCLYDGPTPYRHSKFPYVAFWGKREDRTGVPYGLIRGMVYLQDEVNARISKMQWGLAAVRVERTENAVVDEDTFHDEVARVDADIVLNKEEMRNGGIFKVERDFQLNSQQYERLVDAREGIKRTGGIYNSFMGQNGQASSGVAISSLVEQSTQTLADINDNYRFARGEVGDLLMSLIIEDMIGKQETVLISGNKLKDDREVALNVPSVDEATGIKFLTNDVERVKLKVVLNDVPSTPSFRAQQLSAFSEAYKAMPPQVQLLALPHLLSLMDVPNRDDLIEAVKKAGEMPTPQQIQQQINQAVEAALIKARATESEAKVALLKAQARKTDSEAVNKSVEGMFSATQAAGQIVMSPGVAPLADTLLKSAGFVDKDGGQLVPETPPGAAVDPNAMPRNTDPLTPANPDVGMHEGMETPRFETSEEQFQQHSSSRPADMPID